MICERCPYGKCQEVPESSDYDAWCEKGWGDGYKGCRRIVPYIRKTLDTIISPFYTIKFAITRRKWLKERSNYGY